MEPGRDDEPEPRPTTAATAATDSTAPSSIEPDPWDDANPDDEGYAQSTSTSYLTSIASDIRRGVVEGGRTYAAYGKHKPWLPVDDPEVRCPILLCSISSTGLRCAKPLRCSGISIQRR